MSNLNLYYINDGRSQAASTYANQISMYVPTLDGSYGSDANCSEACQNVHGRYTGNLSHIHISEPTRR